MSTVLCISKSETKLQASNEEATIVLDLPLDHPAAKLFPAGKAIVFAKCRVAELPMARSRLSTPASPGGSNHAPSP